MIQIIKEKYAHMPVQLRASVCFLFCSFLAKAMSSVTTPIFTRLMTTSEYGKFGVFNSWQGILANIISLNMFSGVYSNGVVKFEADRKRYVSSMQGLCFTLAIGWLLVYCALQGIVNAFTKQTTLQMICMVVMIWEAAVFQAWSVGQRTDYKYKNLLTITIIVTIIRPMAGIVFVILGGGTATARILSMAIIDTISYSGLFVYMLYDGKVFFNKEYWSYAVRRGIVLIPHYLSITILASVDRIMISRMEDDSAAGVYNLAYQIAMSMNFFSVALLQTVEPWIYRKHKEGEIKAISRILNISACFMIGVLIVAIAFAPELLRIFAPSEYYEAVNVIPPVAMSILFTYLYTFFATYEFYLENSKFIVIASCIGAVLNIVLNYIFISITNYMAAGYTTLVCYILFGSI